MVKGPAFLTMTLRASQQYLMFPAGDTGGRRSGQALVASKSTLDPSGPRASASVPVTSSLRLL